MIIDILHNPDSYHSLHKGWNSFVRDDPNNLLGMDPTSTYEWFESILAAFPEASESFVIVAYDEQCIVGILPVIVDRASKLGPRLLAPTELYGGRNGLFLGLPNSGMLDRMINCLSKACSGWTTFKFTLVEGSESERVFIEACRQRGYKTTKGRPHESPFFIIPQSYDSILSGMAKDLRKGIRSGERKLCAKGALHFRRYALKDEVGELIDIIMFIEKNSWKSDSGTAITNSKTQQHFYSALLFRAAKANILYACIMYLDAQPIAHLFGLCNQGIFVDLKSSFLKGFEESSAAHVLRHNALIDLLEHGCVAYDFMGNHESHKLRWSNNNRSYARRTWTIYNSNITGIILHICSILKSKIINMQATIKQNKISNKTTQQHKELDNYKYL